MQGSKYVSERSTNDIAKAIRADIKLAMTKPDTDAWALPRGLKVSVRTRKFAGGCSIDVNVTAFPGPLRNLASVLMDQAFPHERSEFPRYTKEVARVLAVLRELMAAYNFDRSDPQSDYFHVRFYGHEGVHWEYERERLAELMASPEVTSFLPDMRVAVAGGEAEMARRAIATMNTGYENFRVEQSEVRALLFPMPAREVA